jgi:hypothetical protein
MTQPSTLLIKVFAAFIKRVSKAVIPLYDPKTLNKKTVHTMGMTTF